MIGDWISHAGPYANHPLVIDTKDSLTNNITTLTGFSGEKLVVPLPMKLIPSQMQLRHLLVRYFDTGWIGAGIKLGVHFQALGRRRARDQTNDDSQARQWLTAPVLTDEGKQPVFNLIPFAAARREVADR